MKNLLYHRVHPRYVQDVLKSNSIKCHTQIVGTQICVTRNVVYMSASRPFVVVFDRDKLRKYFKVKPFCLLGWKFINQTDDFKRWIKVFKNYGFENEERVIAKEIPLELAEYFGELNSGCYDYKKPNKVYCHRLFESGLDINRDKLILKTRKEIRKVFNQGFENGDLQ